MTKPNITASLKDHFLIATPSLQQGFFAQTVTYLCEHNANGAMGIVINKPLGVSLEEIFSSLEMPLEQKRFKENVFAGGPVQSEHGFVLHKPGRSWESTLAISDGFSLTTSRDVLQAISEGRGPTEYLVALGYAGWGAGQLESELLENSWLTVKAEPRIIFDTRPEDRHRAAAWELGIDIGLMSGRAGHA